MELTIDQALQQGIAAHKEGKLQEAERLYRAILQAQPTHPDANHNLGVLAISANRADMALPLLKTALGANPKTEQFWMSYIDALIKETQFEEAKQILDQAKQQGVLAQKLNALEETLNASLSNLKSNLLGQDALSPAIDLREAGKYQEAQQWLNKFIETHPGSPQALSLLSQVLLLDNNDMEAVEVLIKAVSINSDLPSIHLNQARLLLKQSKPDEALEKAQSGYELSSNDPESWLVLAACLGANKRDQDALHWIEKALVSRPQYAEAFANRALIRLRSQDLFGAIKDAEMATSLKPHLNQIWTLLGTLYSQTNNLVGAIEALQQARKIEPMNVTVLLSLGEFLRQDNKTMAALSVLEEAMEINPNSAEVCSNLGNTLHELGRLDEAEASCRRAIDLKPNLPDAHNNLGLTLKALGRLDEAEAGYNQAIALKPDFAEAHSNLGMILQKLGRLDEAEASCRQAIGLEANLPGPHYNLGITLQEQARLDEAESSYGHAIKLKPDYADAHYNLGNTLRELGRLDEAEVSYNQAIALKPDYAEAHAGLLSCLYFLDKKLLLSDKLDDSINHGITNAVVGSLTCRSALRYGIEKPNLFCEEPLKYVLHVDLNTRYNFGEVFVKNARSILDGNRVSNRQQALLVNGNQTFGNLFDIEDPLTQKIQNAIR